jgi:hypothetical protein
MRQHLVSSSSLDSQAPRQRPISDASRPSHRGSTSVQSGRQSQSHSFNAGKREIPNIIPDSIASPVRRLPGRPRARLSSHREEQGESSRNSPSLSPCQSHRSRRGCII